MRKSCWLHHRTEKKRARSERPSESAKVATEALRERGTLAPFLGKGQLFLITTRTLFSGGGKKDRREITMEPRAPSPGGEMFPMGGKDIKRRGDVFLRIILKHEQRERRDLEG